MKPIRPCSFEGCDKKRVFRYYCQGHYVQYKKGKELKPLREKVIGAGCTKEGCDKPHVAKGYCKQHYNTHIYEPGRRRRNGAKERIKIEGPCLFEGCKSDAKVKGFCVKHYYHARVKGIIYTAPCIMDECEKIRYSGEYCRSHHNAWKKYGDPSAKYIRPKTAKPVTLKSLCDRNEYQSPREKEYLYDVMGDRIKERYSE